jgi:hypothetical protein
LSSRFGQKFDNSIKLYAVIKEVDVDDEGLSDFEKYFNHNDIFLDEKKEFHSALGNHSMLNQRLHSWNPLTLYTDFKKLMGRMEKKGIKGNLKGEGLLKGGLFIVTPTAGVVYQHHEVSGTPMPYEEIENVVASLTDAEPVAKGSKKSHRRSADLSQPVCTSREACGDA